MHSIKIVVLLDPDHVYDMIREGRSPFIRVIVFITYIAWFYFDSKITRSNFQTCIYVCVCVINIYEFFVVSVVFAVTAPISNGDNVVYYLMRCTQIKSGLVRPYQYGEFTYQTCNLVVMGHFFEKLKKHEKYII